MLDKLSEFAKSFDFKLTAIINQFVKVYDPYSHPPFFPSHLTNFIKIIIYGLMVLIPFLILKVLYPYKSWITVCVILILVIIALGVCGVFLGLLQLLYTF